ncbi:uncharacterized protein LOC109607267 [Aethina tumida]|uniref:uncharacterized protein LOC109607267 n=1 Tax=Aethina tumida TaxID=116153 RepID=UPI00096B24A3|nr:uncharacterized protein LOC109607267 [Aethina tumida]
MSKESKSYKYFDTPDGENVFKKLVCVLKPTFLSALGVSTADVFLYSHPKGYAKILSRYAFIGLPMIGIATTFVLATNMCAKLTKQDSMWNWAVGGLAAGSLVGVWARHPMMGFNTALTFAISGAIRKNFDQNKWHVFYPDDMPIAYGTVWSVHQDWTLMPDTRPKGWTTAPQEQE